MPAYARKTIIDEEFSAKRYSGGVVSFDGCGSNLAEDPSKSVYVIYTDKSHVKINSPHGLYCVDCFGKWFSKARMVLNCQVFRSAYNLVISVLRIETTNQHSKTLKGY
jgi:hypothetical protein